MRALVLALVPLLAGCLGFDAGRGGWYVFAEPSSCRDCGTEVLFQSGRGNFEMDRAFLLEPNLRVRAYYESPIEAGTRLVLEWWTPIEPDIETREADGDGWRTTERACVPAPTNATSARGVVGPSGAARPLNECVLDFTPDARLEAPGNGIAMLWRIDNRGSEWGNFTFTARLPGDAS